MRRVSCPVDRDTVAPWDTRPQDSFIFSFHFFMSPGGVVSVVTVPLPRPPLLRLLHHLDNPQVPLTPPVDIKACVSETGQVRNCVLQRKGKV